MAAQRPNFALRKAYKKGNNQGYVEYYSGASGILESLDVIRKAQNRNFGINLVYKISPL
jgi:hypothetical protein